MKKVSPLNLTIVGLGIALNIVGAFIALNLRLPIYLDSIGTILVAFVLGPVYGVATGLCGSIVSGMAFDIYSLYFAPVQILVGLLSGLMFKKSFMKGKKMFLGVFVVSIVSSLVSAVICAFVFDGITSSGSTYIVQLLSSLGINKVISVFVVQFLTDYFDKFVAVFLTMPVALGLQINIRKSV